MMRGLFCGALLALWLPLPWLFLTAVCGDTAFFLRAHVGGAVLGAGVAFGAARWIGRAKRPHGAALGAAFALVAAAGLFPLVFTDSIYETWQGLLFRHNGADRVFFVTRAWGAVYGLATGLAAGLLAGSLPAPRAFYLPVFAHLLLGAAAARVLAGILPTPSPDVSLRTATLLLAAFVASLGFCHKAGNAVRRRRVAGFVLAACAVALAALFVVTPSGRGVPLAQLGPFGYWAAADHGFIPMRGTTSAPVLEGRGFVMYDAPLCGKVVVRGAAPFFSHDRFRAPHTLSAAIPFLRAPHAKNAAFIGEFGARSAVAGMALPLDGLVVWEPSRGIFTACGGVDSWTLEINQGRGRAALRKHGEWDIVVVDPGPLWRRGAMDWLAPRTLRKLRASLSEKGVAAVRLDGRGLTPLLLQRILSDFVGAGFEEVCVWQTGVRDFLLTGGAPAPGFDGAVGHLHAHEPFIRELAGAGAHGLPDLLSTLLMDHETALAYARAETEERVKDPALRAWRALFNPLGPALLLETLAGFQARGLGWTFDGGEDDARELEEAVAGSMLAAIAARLEALPALFAHATNDLASVAGPLLESRRLHPRLPLLHDFGDHTELMGRQYAAAENHPMALQYYFLTRVLRPASWAAQLDYAQTLRMLNQNELAYEVLAQAAALAPGVPALRFEKAGLALMLQKWEEALGDYNIVLMDDPGNIAALTSLATLYARRDTPLRDIDRAVGLAERAAKLTAFKDPLAVVTLGDIYILAGRVVDGVRLKQAFRDRQGL